MASECMCPDCKGRVVTKLHTRLDRNQAYMLGYFCARCILMRCTHKCNRRNAPARKKTVTKAA